MILCNGEIEARRFSIITSIVRSIIDGGQVDGKWSAVLPAFDEIELTWSCQRRENVVPATLNIARLMPGAVENEIAEPVVVVVVVDFAVSGRLMHGVRCNGLITRIACARGSAGISARPPESREYSTDRALSSPASRGKLHSLGYIPGKSSVPENRFSFMSRQCVMYVYTSG